MASTATDVQKTGPHVLLDDPYAPLNEQIEQNAGAINSPAAINHAGLKPRRMKLDFFRAMWERLKLRRPAKSKRGFEVLRPASPSHLEGPSLQSRQVDLSVLNDAEHAYKQGSMDLAKYYYLKAASYGSLSAIHNLGVMYLHGQGTAVQTHRARQCFMLCSSHGIAASMSQLGYMYLYGKGVVKDYSRARSWFVRAVEVSGDLYAHYNLAVMYFKGQGVARDYETGHKHLTSSAAGGFEPAKYNLAVCYAEGRYEFQQDVKRAHELYKQLAHDFKNPLATNNLGVFYASGVDRFSGQADDLLEYFIFSSKMGVSAASFNLGKIYLEGGLSSQDSVAAAKNFYKAAKQGRNAMAEYKLGEIFAEGDNKTIKPNLATSIYWFEKAEAHGMAGAREPLRDLRRKSTKKNERTLPTLREHNPRKSHIY